MSLRIDKDNIFTIVPNERYDLGQEINDFMEENFTIFIRTKIIIEELERKKEIFIFSRNGQHSGLSLFIDDSEKVWLQFVYWFKDGNEDVYKQARYLLPDDIKNSFNDYVITCDNKIKKMYFYVNGNLENTIDYEGLIKKDYTKSFFWLGCGDMIAEDEFNGSGVFDIDLVIGLDICLKIYGITYVTNNYKNKYIEYIKYVDLPSLNDKIPYKDNYKLFCDFNYSNIYKIWNFVDNGIFFQKYIKGNIFF